MNAEHESLRFYCSSTWLSLRKSLGVHELVDEIQVFCNKKIINLLTA